MSSPHGRNVSEHQIGANSSIQFGVRHLPKSKMAAQNFLNWVELNARCRPLSIHLCQIWCGSVGVCRSYSQKIAFSDLQSLQYRSKPQAFSLQTQRSSLYARVGDHDNPHIDQVIPFESSPVIMTHRLLVTPRRHTWPFNLTNSHHAFLTGDPINTASLRFWTLHLARIAYYAMTYRHSQPVSYW